MLLLLNATLTQVFTADGLRSDPRNQRVLLDEYSRQRGQISAGGQLLAYSVSTNGRFRFLRVYPNPLTYAPVTGFYSLRYSSTGLERAEDAILNGSDQRLFARRLADFFTGRDPRGGNVATTIDPQVQQAAWDAMQQGCDGPCKGAVVALEPSTGQDPRDGVVAVVRPQPAGHPRRRRAGRGLAAAARQPRLAAAQPGHLGDLPARLDVQGDHHRRGAAGRRHRGHPADRGTTNSVAGQHRNAGELRRGAVRAGPTASLREAFAKSCNTAFVQLGLDTGADALHNTARAFGLDTPPPPIPLQVAESTVGPITDGAALGMSSIGQKDVAVTPLQNALVAATIANDGVTMRPYLVDSLKGPDLANISTTAPLEERRAVSPQVAATLTDLMVGAEQVTQQKGAIAGVQIASKTGTAEHGTDPRNTPPHAWYIAFAPAQAPKVAVAVLVENGGDRLSATGGALAAPIGRATIAAALREGS